MRCEVRARRTAALIVWGCYFATSKEGERTIFKKRRVQPQTRIVYIDKIREATAVQAIARGILQTPRWGIRRDEFCGLDSPPDRF